MKAQIHNTLCSTTLFMSRVEYLLYNSILSALNFPSFLTIPGYDHLCSELQSTKKALKISIEVHITTYISTPFPLTLYEHIFTMVTRKQRPGVASYFNIRIILSEFTQFIVNMEASKPYEKRGK